MLGYGGDDRNPGVMATYYMPKATIRGVSLLSDLSIKGANIDRLCLGRELPDYTIRYADRGRCKVADVFTVAKTGSCAAMLTLDDGRGHSPKESSGPATVNFKWKYFLT